MSNQVLPQDQRQRQQSTRITDVREARKQYQKDLAEYERQVAEFEAQKAAIEEAERKQREQQLKAEQDRLEKERAYKDQITAIDQKYQDEIDRLIAEREELSRFEKENPKVNYQPHIQRKNYLIEQAKQKRFREIDNARLKYEGFEVGVLRQSTVKQLKQNPYKSLETILNEQRSAWKAQAEWARLSSQQTAQSNAIKAATSYAKDASTYSKNITNFGGKDKTDFGRSFNERVAAIKPEQPKATPSIYGYRLTKSTNRPTYVGVTFSDTIATARKPTDVEVIAKYMQGYKSKELPPATVLEGIVQQSDARVTPEGKKLIHDLSVKKSRTVPYSTRTSVIYDPQSKLKFDTKTGEGSFKIGQALGYTYDYNVQRPQTKQQEYNLLVMPSEVKTQKIDFSKLSYSELVDKGVTKIKTPLDQIKYYASRAERPFTAIPDALGLGGEYRQKSFEPSTFDRFFIAGERAIKKEKTFDESLKDIYKYAAKDPIGVASEIPAESALWITGGKVVSLGSKGLLKVSDKVWKSIKPYVKNTPTIDKQTGKIYPKRQKQLTPEQVNKPVTSFETIKVKVGKAQVKTKYGKQPRPVKSDATYTPAKRASEIDTTLDDALAQFSKQPVKVGKAAIKTPPRKLGKQTKVVESDPSYKPASRANEIDVSPDDALATFSKMQAKLGKGSPVKTPPYKQPIKPPKPVELDPFYKASRRTSDIDLSKDDLLSSFTRLRIGLGSALPKTKPKPLGKQVKPVQPDETYKPASRANEIDVSPDDALATFSRQPVKLGKSVIKPKAKPSKPKTVRPSKKYKPSTDVDEIKRRLASDTKYYGFGETKAGLGGGITQGSKQKTVQVLKTKKLKTQRKTPLPLDYSLKESTAKIPPPSSKAPITTIPVYRKKSKQKKKSVGVYGGTAAILEYNILATPVSKASEQYKLKTNILPKVEQKTTVSPKVTTIQTRKIRPSVRQTEKVKTTQIERYRTPIKPKTRTVTRTPMKIPTRLTPRQTPKQPLRPRQRLQFAVSPPPKQPIPIMDTPPPIKTPKREPKTPKKRAKRTVDFVGNAPITKVVGIYKKKSETVYGSKKVRKRVEDEFKQYRKKGKKKRVKIF